MKNSTIQIEGFVSASRVKVFKFGKEIPLEENRFCFVCGKPLKVIAVLESGDGSQKVRLGLCEGCGYVGYIDRPSEKWMIDFYSRDWDKGFARTREDVLKNTELIKEGSKAGRYLTFSLVEKIGVDKERPVCEVGAGYGEILYNFERAGFKKIVGVENSARRAEFVKKTFGYEILSGEFESPEVQAELLRFKPFGTFFSHHVLEHTYRPDKIINLISGLQSNGDFLVLSLPNVEGEHINYSLFYLVHLHSFTKESLEILLNKNGYEIVVDNSPDDSNIVIAAQKTQSPRPRFKIKQNYFDSISGRIRKGLAFEQMTKPVWHALHWEQGSERDMARTKELGSGFLPKSLWRLRNMLVFVRSRFFRRFTSGYAMLVFPKNDDSDVFKIRFPDKISFLIK